MKVRYEYIELGSGQPNRAARVAVKAAVTLSDSTM